MEKKVEGMAIILMEYLLSNHLISLLSWLRHLVGSLKQSAGHQMGPPPVLIVSSSIYREYWS